MNAERWQRVKQLLDSAIALEAGERSAFLDRACDGDAELRREIDSLLSSHEQAGTGFLKTPVANLKSMAAAPPARAGRVIGPYRIVEEIGHGGMGEVYRAVRADGQYTKEVAVKLVRGGFDSRSVQERFRNERQILASLDHANIARLLDGGTTDDGVPYLVMELIDGARIDSYCDEHRLSITERLRLFRQVCGAVQFAHQRLVIHRDIKPSNILVTKEGVPKLLDFGIAKILDPAGAGAETTLARPMTPEYASPEQIRGEPITTASDVYSLGVVLYQLLTGRSPYPGETRSAHELARAVCETQPGRPSTAVLKPQRVRLGDQVELVGPERVSSLREGSPAKLRRRLAGDLDNIVLMALRKEPEQRYASVEQLANDLRHHMEGMPVAARTTSWHYRTTKFIGRHKVGAFATAAALLILLAGVIVIVRESRLAAENGRRAQQRFNDIRQLADSLMFEVHDSIQDLPGATPARQLIVQRSLEYLNRLAKDSAGDDSLQRELANAYERIGLVQGDPDASNLGDIAGARDSFRKALDIREKLADLPSNQNSADQIALAASDREVCRISARYLGSIGTALDYCNKAVSIAERQSKSEPSNRIVMTELAKDYEATGRAYGENSTAGNAGNSYRALESHRKALALVEELTNRYPGDLDLNSWRGSLSILTADDLFETGHVTEAVPLYRQATRTFESITGRSNNLAYQNFLPLAYQRMGDMLLVDGRFKQSLTYYRKQLEVATRLVAADPKSMSYRGDLAASRATYGHALWRAGHVQEGLAMLRSGLDEIAASRQKDARARGLQTTIQLWMAGGFEKAGDWKEALHHYQLAQATYRGICESDPQDIEDCITIPGILDRVGRIHLQQGRVEEALSEYQNALARIEPLSIGNEPNLEALYTVVNVYYGLGEVYRARADKAGRGARSGDWAQAHNWYQKCRAAHLRIPNWQPITPNEFESRKLNAIEARLALFQRPPAHAAASGVTR
jgi:non-specific serine/threonine protein kinase/serine/threonine-protein kinase